jgi:hypothetical protein
MKVKYYLLLVCAHMKYVTCLFFRVQWDLQLHFPYITAGVLYVLGVNVRSRQGRRLPFIERRMC